ncbi:MAG TPA: hypothetical protein DEO54_00650 [Rikenellaceae bacterium]|nr:MAG: hypothetical protein A2X20_01400 [Bacteroidetes bacterium GWE2_40_15]HBZ24732.1 hypothetical protein [Rikenellaceae bacterium]
MHKSQRVLVTGANGLLGSNVVNQLAKKGYRAIVIVRKSGSRVSLKELECEIIECNLTNVWELEQVVKECDFIIHCAANTQQKPTGLTAYEQINIELTSNLIQLSKKYGIKRFIQVSTANCFTNGSLDNPGDETGGFMPWLKDSGYAYSKYLAQEMVLKEAAENSFPAIVVAPTFIIGPRDANISSGKLIMYGINRRIVFYPPGGKSIVDAEYAAEAIVNSLTMGRIGECYLLSGENLTYREIFQKIGRVSNKKGILLQIPRWFLVLIANLFSFIEKVFCVSSSLNITNQKLLCLDNYFTNQKAVEELKLRETNTDLAIEKAINWFRDKRYL